MFLTDENESFARDKGYLQEKPWCSHGTYNDMLDETEEESGICNETAERIKTQHARLTTQKNIYK